MIKVAPSLLAADYLRIGDDIRRMADAGADWLEATDDGSMPFPAELKVIWFSSVIT